MKTAAAGHQWERLPNGYDVELRHAIPVRISDNGHGLTVPAGVLQEQITALSQLRVALGDWVPGELPGEHEARVVVSRDDFAEVLRRLAVASATLFVERYHRAVDDEDVDWDLLEYRSDFGKALEHCGTARGAVNMDDLFAGYTRVLHQETQRLVQSGTSPPVVPE